MKRIKRKQLKEDELITTVGKIIRFAKKRSKELFALGVAVVLFILIFAGARLLNIQNVKKESRLLSQIIELNSKLDETPENVEKLKELAGKGKFSRLAYLFLASYWVEREDFDKAEASLQKIIKGKKDIFYYQAQDLLAQIYTKRKDFDKAIDIYKKIEEKNPKEYALDVILFHQAEAFEQKGDIKKALALYKKVQEEFPQTYFGFDASQKVMKLETKK